MTVGQKITFEYRGNNFLFTVNQAGVEGQGKPDIERGMLCTDTYIVFEAASGSGIKVGVPSSLIPGQKVAPNHCC